MFFISLLHATVFAGSIGDLSEMEQTMVLCSRAADDTNTQSDRVDAWRLCSEQASANGLTSETVTRVEGQLAWEQYKLDHSEDPLTLASLGLREWANGRLWLPSEGLVSMWLTLNADPDTRSNLSDVHVVTLRWLPSSDQDAEFAATTYDYLVRSIADAGFRVPAPEHTDSSNADIYLNVSMSESEGEPSDQVPAGAVHTYRVALRANSVNFETKEIRTGPLEADGEASDSRVAQARTESMEKAASSFAIGLVERVVRVVFREHSD